MLETARLLLIPLSGEEMRLWVSDLPALEARLQCSYRDEVPEGHFENIVRGQAEAAGQNPVYAQWYSFWWLVRKSDHAVLGSADFKGPPNAQGEVEIGYGLSQRWEGQGYMTEAASALCAFALAKKEVSAVLAETEPDAAASQKVLAKCGFKKILPRTNNLWWALYKK